MIYFVTEKYIKTNTAITNNIDFENIAPLIKNAAEMWTRSTLGSYFYNDLLVKYNNLTLSNDELDLVVQMKPSIAWRACADAVIELSFQLKNKGVQGQSGDYSDSVDFKSIGFLNHHYNDNASFYESRLQDYLLANKDLFPNYLSPLNKDSILKNKFCNGNDSFNTNILFI